MISVWATLWAAPSVSCAASSRSPLMSRRLRAWRCAWMVHVENVRSSRSWSLVATLLAFLNQPSIDGSLL